MNITKEKQAVKAPDLFKGKCIYTRLNQDTENPDALKEIFTKGLEQLQEKRIIVTSKQAAAIHFKSPDEAKAALEAVRGVQIDGGFRLSILQGKLWKGLMLIICLLHFWFYTCNNPY